LADIEFAWYSYILPKSGGDSPVGIAYSIAGRYLVVDSTPLEALLEAPHPSPATH
jgi:hypothetical protein